MSEREYNVPWFNRTSIYESSRFLCIVGTGTGNWGQFLLKMSNMTKEVIIREERRVFLTPTEYRLLYYLASHSSQTLSTQALLDNFRGRGFKSMNLLRVQIRRLREKIEETPSNPRYIVTDNDGYRYVP